MKKLKKHLTKGKKASVCNGK